MKTLIKINNILCKNKLITFALGGIVGVVVFLSLYGFLVLDFTNVSWLKHSNDLEGLWDLTQHYYGWIEYRNAPWRFPIGLLENVCANPISVAYTDSIPLFAIIFKVLSPILPSQFQYFGLFELITYILVGGFGALITYKYSKNSIYNILSAFLFVISPVLTKRVFYHSALSAHFLILASILIWIYRDEISDKMFVVYQSILMMCCTLINPYYVPMCMGILLLELLSEFIIKRRYLYTVISAIIPGICSLIIGYPLGLFYGNVSASGAAIEKVSFNLNQLINPYNPMLVHWGKTHYFEDHTYSSIIPSMPLVTDWQMEGNAYLGLGVIALVIIAIVLVVKSIVKHEEIDEAKRKKKISIGISIIVGIVIFTLLALGPSPSLGSKVLYTIPWPEKIYKLFAIFRTAGRLIWPVYYGIMAVSLIIIASSFKGKTATIILIAFSLLQVIDIYPSLRDKEKAFDNVTSNEEDKYVNQLAASDVWQYLGCNSDEIIFDIPTQTTICLSPYWSCTFEDFAIENDLKMSASYCSRDVSSLGDSYANENYEKRKNGEKFEDVIYVYLFDFMLEDDLDKGLNIYKYNDITIGTDRNLDGFDELVSVE